MASDEFSWRSTAPKIYNGSYVILDTIGEGAWSTVYEVRSITPGNLTPPASPVNRTEQTKILAIKRPSHRAARKVIANEACTLSYLSSLPHYSTNIVRFHGLNTATGDLVLERAVTTLGEHAHRCGVLMKENFSTRTMFDPVVGNETWQRFAKALIDGLQWLHTNGCAHGDIKASNILLRAGHTLDVLEPVFCDFSSATIMGEPAPGDDDGNGDAITPSYTAPEVFASYRTKAAVCKQKADVWSLAVVLVVAAVGEEPYEAFRNPMQKQAMAREGAVLEAIRGGSQGTRVMRGRMVEKAVRGALVKNAEKRCSAEEWLAGLEVE